MKRLVLIACALSILGVADVDAHNYEKGESLTVMATSGLRLRMSPEMTSATIHILRFGDTVVVSDTHGFASAYAARVGWMDGHWIKVRHGNLSGYVFDSFLSTLHAPTHENQLCIDCPSVIFPLDRYLADNYHAVHMQEGSGHREDVSQFVTTYQEGMTATRTAGEGWYQLEVEFTGRRICEVLNLLRAMVVDDRLRQSFEDTLIFHTGRNGHVEEVGIHLYPNPITLTDEHGLIRLTSVVITDEGGC
ncbi:MAG: hypothetical protein R3301_02775 [Saprospiraceae bacterium]|nr:hypothetical protein [Saprospiraceae bacterium]